jgi:hypothetical protein
VLEHYCEGETVYFSFFGAFPSDRIHKMTRGINVNFFIHSFTFRNELILENALAVKNSCKSYQRIPGKF